jgi:hypothetical protein
MVFYKDIDVVDLKLKYGGTQRGLFARERIEKGELIWHCLCGDIDKTYTRDELLDLIAKHPNLDYFVRSYSYMIDDDLYNLPETYMLEKNNDECALFNHSCIPNCGFDEDGNGIIAIRTIEPGDELTYHYGFLETEASLIYNLPCLCNSSNCAKWLLFNNYRDPQFVHMYFPYMTPYLRKKCLDINQGKWHSEKCYVKRVSLKRTTANLSNDGSGSSGDDSSVVDDEETYKKALFSLFPLKKGELVAVFANENEIQESQHYLRQSINPNCYVDGKNVFVCEDVPSETELTLYYHGRLL